MILRIFRKSYLPQYLILAVLATLLWGGAFVSPPGLPDAGNPYLNPGYDLLIRMFGNNPLLYALTAFLLMLASALLFNLTVEKNGLSESNSLIPAFIFILVMSLFPSLQTLHPAMIPGFLAVVVLYHVFDIYTEAEAYPKVFNSGFYIALSSFFYFPSIVFLLFVWSTFVVYRLYSWREWVILLFGFLTPYVLLWTWFFWADELALVFDAYRAYFSPKWMPGIPQGLTILNYVSAGLLAFLFIRGLFTQALSMQEKVISVRKRFWAVILFFLVALASFLFSGNLAQYHMVFIQLSFALVIQGLMFHLRKVIITDILLWLILVLVLFNNYYVAFLSLVL